MKPTRRTFLGAGAMSAAALSLAEGAAAEAPAIVINPEPRFALSPHLYMQFMEPLGATEGSVEASWDHQAGKWKAPLVDTTRSLAPTMMRWGGCFASYYKWKEGVGPREQRTPMFNLLWGGLESNQVGTREFVDFSRQVGADPLICVNFESDGRERWMKDSFGRSRFGDASEAAEWVAYCNAPKNALRRQHGVDKPLGVRHWQIGNETSYDQRGMNLETAVTKTIEFAKAMRAVDPEIELVGWADSGWARRMAEGAGEHLQYLAFHNMFNPDRGDADSPLQGVVYREDPARTWEHLMAAYKTPEGKLLHVREEVKGLGIPLAITECHFTLPGRNRCEVLSTWAAGVANARLLNVYERNGDMLKIATLADFCGNRWQNNAVMLNSPGGPAYLMPVAHVMRLYRRHVGAEGVDVSTAPEELDLAASRTGNRVYLHAVNTNRTRPVKARIEVGGMRVTGGTAYEIAADPMYEVISPDTPLEPKEKAVPADGMWEFPAASVTALGIEVVAMA